MAVGANCMTICDRGRAKALNNFNLLFFLIVL
jgi:hypothetical protein